MLKARHIANTERQDHLISVNDRVEELGERLEDQDNLTLEEVESYRKEFKEMESKIKPEQEVSNTFSISTIQRQQVPDLKL